MNGRLNQIQADLQLARTVMYLEGKTDPEILFALLGIRKPASAIHKGVYVAGLGNRGSGNKEVTARVQEATASGLALTAGGGGVLGILDGDGRPLVALASEFDPPYFGQMYSWKGYSIENLLAKAAWPAGWGAPPDWRSCLESYAPYAGLNRVQCSLQTALATLGLADFRHPDASRPLLDDPAIRAVLASGKDLIQGRDVEREYDTEVGVVRLAITRSLDEGHAFINGKWFIKHYAHTRGIRSEDTCRTEWCEAVRQTGGLPEVRDWWQRITGAPP